MNRSIRVLLLLFVSVSLFAQQPDVDRRRLQQLVDIQKRNEAAILARPGVRALGIGIENGVLVFRLFVAQEAPPKDVPAQIEGVPVRVVLIGPIKALAGLMGTSTSNSNPCYSGTLGFRAVDGSNPAVAGYVTNNHVAVAGGASLCPNTASSGTKQYSPSMGDNSCKTATEIGRLNRFVSIDFAATALNRVDAAFVERSGEGPDERTDCGFCFPPTGVVSPISILGGAVRKCGRTTHLTNGTVTSINTTASIGYDNCGSAKFDGQIVVTGTPQPFSQKGDSGSAVYAATGLVGLLFAGDANGTAFINPISDVLSKLNVTPGNGTFCVSSGSDSAFGGVGTAGVPRVYLAPGGAELLVAIAGGTLLKFKSPGGTGHNLFAIEKSGNVWTGVSCYAYLLGSQNFPAEIRDVDFIGGVTLVSLADGRIVKVNGTGGTGQNMFALTVAPSGFTGVPGFPYYVGSHKFSSGIADVTVVGGETIISFDNGRMLKVKGSGGTGFNFFAIADNGSSFSAAGGNFYIGDQALGSAITAVAAVGSELLAATANGKVLKVTGTGGTGHNMFAVTITASGYDRFQNFPYYLGDQKFSGAVTRVLPTPTETILALNDGRLLKIQHTGGTGHNMFAVDDHGTSFSRTGNFPYYVGDQKVSAAATAMTMVGSELLVGFANGKMLKVTGTGGTGHNMFAVQETANGFTTVPNPTTYLRGSTNLGASISQVTSIAGFTWVGVGTGKLLKVNASGGTGFNMFAVAQTPTEFSGLCSFNHFAGSQAFR